jgi:predicted transcriptional regulator
MTFPSRPLVAPTVAGRIRDRFGVVADAGYQPLPDMLLFHQVELKLSSEDLNVLLNLMAHWYEPERWPFPKAKTIGERMGVSERTVHRSLKRMQKNGVIKKIARGGDGMGFRGGYDLRPVLQKLSIYATEKIAARRRPKIPMSSKEDAVPF